MNYLDLHGNNIKILRFDEFMISSELKYLSLSNNKLDIHFRLTRQYFKLLTNLDFSNNLLHSFECENYFKEFSPLEILILNKNLISIIQKSSFKYLSGLIELHLSSNNISKVDWDSFENLEKLALLNLDTNYLTELGEKLFNYFYRLTFLNLSSNSLTFIKKKLLKIYSI